MSDAIGNEDVEESFRIASNNFLSRIGIFFN